MSAIVNHLALDIGARSHACAACVNGRTLRGDVANTPETLATLLQRLQPAEGRLQVLLEATGIYFLDPAVQAVQAGAEVMVVNPKAAHHFAKATAQRSKTDALDAKMLLTYLQRMPFQAWQPPSTLALHLRRYGRYLGQLTEQRTRLKNQLHALLSTRSSPALLREDQQAAIDALTQRIERIAAEALRLIQAEPKVRARYQALLTIRGIGSSSAVGLLGELLCLPRQMNSRACVCHAGLDVRLQQSGVSVAAAARLSKHGNKYLRRALFMPAMTAIVHDSHARAFRDRLLARGKKKLQAIAAVMRKMLTAIWALVRQPATYDGSRLYRAQEG